MVSTGEFNALADGVRIPTVHFLTKTKQIMRALLKILLVGCLTSAMYYYAEQRDVLFAQILAWCCMAFSMYIALALVVSYKFYTQTMKILSGSPLWYRIPNYGFIAFNIHALYGSALGYIYLILIIFFEALYLIAKLSTDE